MDDRSVCAQLSRSLGPSLHLKEQKVGDFHHPDSPSQETVSQETSSDRKTRCCDTCFSVPYT